MIDLRSDTVTTPTAAMRAAMTQAEVGDDVYGEDPTVNRLQAMLAERAGMEAGLFVPSGTQSNLVALLTHCARGDEYIVGQQAHTYKYEGGGAAVLGGIQPQPLEFEPDGTLALDKVRAAIKAQDDHFARTRLLCLENTVHGKVLPLDYLAAARAFAAEHGLALHLDGARVFNAAVKLGVELNAITRHFDTVSICLSKGLGAPVGSVLCGSRDFIERARRWRKVTGGGMRQAGILAAAGIHALAHHVTRLAEDHANAAALAKGLAAIAGLGVQPVQTNMVFVTLPNTESTSHTLSKPLSLDGRGVGERVKQPSHPHPTLQAQLRQAGIIISAGNPLRMVTHLDISAADVTTVIQAFRSYFA